MSRYDDAYGEWETLGTNEASERAYALGVEAALGHTDEAELAAVRGEMESAYARSVVDLAFDEGRTAGRKAKRGAGDAAVAWDELVLEDALEGGDDVDDGPDGTRASLDRFDLLEKVDPDSRDVLELPQFLQR